MNKIIRIVLLCFCVSTLMTEVRPLAMKAFDHASGGHHYNRGTYMIIIPSALSSYLDNETYGGDFVMFKKTQGFDVELIHLENIPFASNEISAQEIKNFIYNYYSTDNMLEYVLLVGDVNGSYKVPTFTIDSYNEEDIDVTDYPYTFSDDVYEPDFFVGRWSVGSVVDFLNIKSRSIQYIKMDNLESADFLNNSLLVAGNYKTAEGEIVPPSQWPVTPVWTSLWLMEELQNYGYTQIDTAFFHAGNWETAEYNPLIDNAWNDGVGIINYRGWGDANGWHKPYYHREEVEGLNNGWRLPVVMSFVCNTGDFGNDYSGTGLGKCFGETLITAGSIVNPKGAAAMVGPSDLDTDTRFNNVICGFMWDALLYDNIVELAPALHAGKHALINEFSGLSAPDGTVIDYFYHHVYGVLGDPSLPVWLKEPGDISIAFTDDSPSSDLIQSWVSLVLTDDETGEILPGVVGALLDSYGNLVAKSVSNTSGVLIVDWDQTVAHESILTLYLNAPQYKQAQISLNYLFDNGINYPDEPSSDLFLIPLDIATDITLGTISGPNLEYYYTYSYVVPGQPQNFIVEFYNNSSKTISFDPVMISLSEYMYDEYIPGTADEIPPFESVVFIGGFTISLDAEEGTVIPFKISFLGAESYEPESETNDHYEVQDFYYDWIVSSSEADYFSSNPSPECDYGYQAYDHTDLGFDEVPVYDWLEINEVGANLNLTDDSHINDVQIGFDFKYFGEVYNSMTVCSNGWASFESCPISHFWNFSIPNPMGPSAMVAPFMDDLDDNGGTVPLNVYAYNMGDGRFVLEWDHILNGEDDQNCPDCIDETFQMILFDPAVYPTATGDGNIVFQYKEVYDLDQNGNYSTIGIESPDQDDGVEYLFSSQPGLGSYWEPSENGAYENIAIKFTTGMSSCMVMDLNNDGITNVIDIINIINIIIAGGTSDPNLQCAADVNGDSIINVIDIIQIVNYIIS